MSKKGEIYLIPSPIEQLEEYNLNLISNKVKDTIKGLSYFAVALLFHRGVIQTGLSNPAAVVASLARFVCGSVRYETCRSPRDASSLRMFTFLFPRLLFHRTRTRFGHLMGGGITILMFLFSQCSCLCPKTGNPTSLAR